jgi:hypothetical protein
MKTSADLDQLQQLHELNAGHPGDARWLRDIEPCAGSGEGADWRNGWDKESAGPMDLHWGGGMVGVVEAGIRARGYHVMPVDEVAGLVGGVPVCRAEFLRQLHRFASVHGWEAAAPRGVSHVLFQPIGDRCVVPSIWRLQRAVQG